MFSGILFRAKLIVFHLHSLNRVFWRISLMDEVRVLHIFSQSLQKTERLIKNNRHGDLRQLLKDIKCIKIWYFIVLCDKKQDSLESSPSQCTSSGCSRYWSHFWRTLGLVNLFWRRKIFIVTSLYAFITKRGLVSSSHETRLDFRYQSSNGSFISYSVKRGQWSDPFQRAQDTRKPAVFVL